MRFPISVNGTLEEYERDWYSAQKFGNKTNYGYHDGEDFNLKSGGDTDIGQPLYAVANGKIAYYHNASHPTTGFGRHLVIECDTTYGKRWYHYAHCQEITAQAKTVTEGEVIGKLGKSGTTYAHLHFAVFKVDPSTLRSGIDTIAKTETELNNWWENPFITLKAKVVDNAMISNWFATLLQEANLSLDKEGEFRSFWSKAIKYDEDVRNLQEQVKSVNEALSDRALEVSTLTEKNQKLSDRKDELEEEVNRLRGERDKATWENTQLTIKVEALENEIDRLHREIEQHEQKNDIYAYSWIHRFISLFKK